MTCFQLLGNEVQEIMSHICENFKNEMDLPVKSALYVHLLPHSFLKCYPVKQFLHDLTIFFIITHLGLIFSIKFLLSTPNAVMFLTRIFVYYMNDISQ